MVGGGIWEIVYDTDKPTFLKRELVGFGMDGYLWARVHDRTSGLMPIHMFQEHLTYFSNVKSITFHKIDLVHQIEGFIVSKGNDGIRQFNIKASE